MSNTGKYIFEPGKGLVKISDHARIQPSVHFPSGGRTQGYYDTSAQRRFTSKAEKRQWMKQHGLKEGGIVNPDKAFEM